MGHGGGCWSLSIRVEGQLGVSLPSYCLRCTWVLTLDVLSVAPLSTAKLTASQAEVFCPHATSSWLHNQKTPPLRGKQRRKHRCSGAGHLLLAPQLLGRKVCKDGAKATEAEICSTKAVWQRVQKLQQLGRSVCTYVCVPALC